VVLLPYGARSWYIRTDTAGRSYRAQLGVTLPSGEFQLLAESNTVTAPRVGPAATRATTRVHYATGVVSLHSGASRRAADPGPWQPAPQGEGSGGSADEEGTPRKSSSDMAPRGGASETYRR